MAILTELTLPAARQLVGEYGLSLVEIVPLASGSVNSNFFVRAHDQNGVERQLFARIFEEQSGAGAEFELELNHVLSIAGLPTARPLRKLDDGLAASFEGKPFGLYERLRGEISCQARVNEARCFAVGAALAQVHLAPLGDLELSPSRFGFAQIRQRLDRVRSSGRQSLQPACEQLEAECARLEGIRPRDLPHGLIHGDLFRDNVLLAGDEVSGLLDFESASLGSFAYDLMVTVLAWCFGSELELGLTRALLAGYQSIRPLTDIEKDALIIEGSVACARFATTRLTDFSLRVPEDQPPLRDFRRFFSRKQALESGLLQQALAPA